jgi:cation transport ATPase
MKKNFKRKLKNKNLLIDTNYQGRDNFGRFKKLKNSNKMLNNKSKNQINKTNLNQSEKSIKSESKKSKDSVKIVKKSNLTNRSLKATSNNLNKEDKNNKATNYSFWLRVMSLILSIISVVYYTQRFLRFNGLNIIGLTTIFRNFNLFPDTNYQLMLTLNPSASILLNALFVVMAIVVLINLVTTFITVLSIRDWFLPNMIASLTEAGIIVTILTVLFIFFEFSVFALLTYLGLFFMLGFAMMKVGNTVWNYFIREE